MCVCIPGICSVTGLFAMAGVTNAVCVWFVCRVVHVRAQEIKDLILMFLPFNKPTPTASHLYTPLAPRHMKSYFFFVFARSTPRKFLRRVTGGGVWSGYGESKWAEQMK